MYFNCSESMKNADKIPCLFPVTAKFQITIKVDSLFIFSDGQIYLIINAGFP